MEGRLLDVTTLLCLIATVTSLEIDISDGGYKDLLISIHKDVPYNESIVENIKTLLQTSSEFLHTATNGRLYFKHVTIDFPNTWPQRNSSRRVSWSSFEKSDVRVQQPGSPHQNRPFTRQSRPCGQPGDFIQIPTEFLAELNVSTTAKYINPAYVFVHEWAHYRYGVFDEYGSQDDNTYPLTYCPQGTDTVKLNSCSDRIRYRATTASGGKCKISKKCQFLKDCTVQIFQPQVDPAEASIMFMPYQSNISQFCESKNGSRQHNAFAPNKQNRNCNGRPTWDVISDNEDFQTEHRSDMSKRIQVVFEETQQKEVLPQRVVLVLDVSGSMEDNSRLEILKEAAHRYIEGIPDGGKRLAMVIFSRIALVHHTMMPVNVRTRQGFLDSVGKLKSYTSTCIGCGLKLALEILDSPTSFTQQLDQTFTLESSLGNSTIVLVKQVAQSSGHITMWLVDPDGQRCHACRESARGDTKIITIPSPAKEGTWTLHLESSASDEVEVNIQVKSQAKNQNEEPIRASCRMAKLEVKKPTQAVILAEVTKGTKIVLHAEVTAEVSRPKPPHKVQVQLNDDGKDPDVQANDGTYSGYFTQFAGKGRYAVMAHVSGHQKTRLADPKPGSGSSFTTATLLTSSLGADPDANYEYTLDEFIVVNTTSEEDNTTSAGGQVVDPFQRVASGGSFQVTEEILEEQVPPGDIRDLAVTDIRPEVNGSFLVKIIWTWPGARLTAGNASSVEIRASKDHANLNSDFEKQIEITKANVVDGSLDPLPSGTKHKVTVSLPHSFATTRADGAYDWSAYLAARVANSDGLKSKISNVVPVTYTPPPVTTTVATTTAATTTQKTTTVATSTARTTTTSAPTATAAATTTGAVEGPETKTRLLPLWAWILIGVVAILIIVAISIGVLVKSNLRNRGVYYFAFGRSNRGQQESA